MIGVADGSADYIVAQSIYSHTGENLFRRSVSAIARCLNLSGQALFTVVLPGDESSEIMPLGSETEGWLYPYCLAFTEPEVFDICQGCGLHIQRLPWFHPRQTWFRAVTNPAHLMNPSMLAELGTGKPLFDERFKGASPLRGGSI